MLKSICGSLVATLIATLSGSLVSAGRPAVAAKGRPLPRPPVRRTVASQAPRPTFALQVGHSGGINTVAFSRDGKTLATASRDRTVRLWDVETGRLKTTLQETFLPIAFSPDGRLLATNADRATARVWDARTGQLKVTLEGEYLVSRLAFSPDSKTLATIGGRLEKGKTVEASDALLWEVATGRLKARLRGHVAVVTNLAFAPDGKTLATVSYDKTARLWDVPTRRLKATLQGHTELPYKVAFSPDGKTLATAGDEPTPRLWDTMTGQLKAVLQGHTAPAVELAFSPDGKTLASGSLDRTVRLWDTQSGESKTVLQGHTEWVKTIAFSPDGKILASGGMDGTARLWDMPGGRLRATLQGHTADVNTLAFSPDGKTLATGSDDKTARLWDAQTGRLQATLQGHTKAIRTFAFSPDGKTLATGVGYAYRNDPGEVRLWDAEAGQLKATLQGHAGSVDALAFSPDGRTLATGSPDKTARLWDARSGQFRAILQGHTDRVGRLVFSPDGKTLATGSADSTARLWDVESGQLRATLEHPTSVATLVFSPDGKILATGTAGGRFPKFWGGSVGPYGGLYRVEVDSNQVHGGRYSGRIQFSGARHEGGFGTLTRCLSPEAFLGKRVRFSGFLKTERVSEGWAGLWLRVDGPGDTSLRFDNMADRAVKGTTDWKQYEIVLDVPREATQICFGFLLSGNGSLWGDDLKLEVVGERDLPAAGAQPPPGLRNLDFEAGIEGPSVRLWDTESGQLKATLQGHTENIPALAFSPDGKTLATGSRDKTVRLWDVNSGQAKTLLQGQTTTVSALAFSPDGKWLATGGGEFEKPGEARVWNVQTGQLQATLPRLTNWVVDLGFSDDGKVLATRDTTRKLQLWDAATGQPIPITPQTGLKEFPLPIARLGVSTAGAAVSLHDPKDDRVLATMLPIPEVAEEVLVARPLPVGAKAAPAPTEEWCVTTPSGYFDCSANAARFILWNVNGVLYPAERYLRRFRRPDLVRKALRGEKITAPEMTVEDIPPDARFVGLRNGEPASGDTITVTVDVRDDREVKEVELLVNGRPLSPVQARPIQVGAKTIAGDAMEGNARHGVSKQFTFRVSLPVGAEEIRLRATAYDDAELGSDPVEVVLRRTGAQPATGRLYVLSTGVSRYRNADGKRFANLQFPAADARAIAERFQREGKPLYAEVHVRTLTDQQATAANVRAGLKWLQESVRPGQIDTVVIFLSGHGISAPNGRYYFATHDLDLKSLPGTSLAGSELREALGGKLRAKAVFLFVDTCHAGGLGGRSDDLALEVGEGVFLLASSGARDYAYESESWGHGAFTLALLRSLDRRELASNGVLHFNALTYAVPEEVARLMTEAGRSENEQEPCVPLAARRLRMPIVQAAR